MDTVHVLIVVVIASWVVQTISSIFVCIISNCVNEEEVPDGYVELPV